MKILLTGASGFLGSALALALQDAGHEVALLLRTSSSLRRLQGRRFEVVRPADDTARSDFVRQFAPQAVVHTACAYGRQGESTLDLLDVNLRLGVALINSLPTRCDGPCLFINTGTGLPPGTSAYALSKYQFAAWGRLMASMDPGRLQFVNVELQHMFGAGDDPSKFTTHVVRSCYEQLPVLKLTAGDQQRDFIYIDDVVSAYLALLRASSALGSATDVPVGSGAAPPVRAFVETVHRLCRSKTRLEFGALPYRPNEAMHCQADLRLMHELGWAPRWTLEAALEKMIQLEF